MKRMHTGLEDHSSPPGLEQYYGWLKNLWVYVRYKYGHFSIEAYTKSSFRGDLVFSLHRTNEKDNMCGEFNNPNALINIIELIFKSGTLQDLENVDYTPFLYHDGDFVSREVPFTYDHNR